MNNQHHGGGFFNGFVIGLIIGAAIVFLFGTKTGKRVLKAISENGLDDLADLAGLLTEEPLEDMADVPVPMRKTKSVMTEMPEAEVIEATPVTPKKTGPKRFFKGIKKR